MQISCGKPPHGHFQLDSCGLRQVDRGAGAQVSIASAGAVKHYDLELPTVSAVSGLANEGQSIIDYRWNSACFAFSTSNAAGKTTLHFWVNSAVQDLPVEITALLKSSRRVPYSPSKYAGNLLSLTRVEHQQAIALQTQRGAWCSVRLTGPDDRLLAGRILLPEGKLGPQDRAHAVITDPRPTNRGLHVAVQAVITLLHDMQANRKEVAIETQFGAAVHQILVDLGATPRAQRLVLCGVAFSICDFRYQRHLAVITHAMPEDVMRPTSPHISIAVAAPEQVPVQTTCAGRASTQDALSAQLEPPRKGAVPYIYTWSQPAADILAEAECAICFEPGFDKGGLLGIVHSGDYKHPHPVHADCWRKQLVSKSTSGCPRTRLPVVELCMATHPQPAVASGEPTDIVVPHLGPTAVVVESAALAALVRSSWPAQPYLDNANCCGTGTGAFEAAQASALTWLEDVSALAASDTNLLQQAVTRGLGLECVTHMQPQHAEGKLVGRSLPLYHRAVARVSQALSLYETVQQMRAMVDIARRCQVWVVPVVKVGNRLRSATARPFGTVLMLGRRQIVEGPARSIVFLSTMCTPDRVLHPRLVYLRGT